MTLLGRFPRSLLIALLATGLVRIGYGAILPVLPLYASQKGLSPLAIAAMTNAYLLSHALLQGPAGSISDRLGRRPVLLAGALLHAAVAALFLLGEGGWSFTWLKLAEGLAAALVGPVIRALLVDLVEPAARGQAFGALTAVDNAGLFLGPLVGGWAAGVWGLKAPFVAGSLLCLAATLLLLALRVGTGVTQSPHAPATTPPATTPPATTPPATAHPDTGQMLEGWQALLAMLKATAFWVAALPGIAFAFLAGLYSVIWSLYMQNAGATPWQISLSFALYALPVVLLVIPFGALTDRVGRWQMTLSGGLLAALVTFGYGLFPVPVILLTLSALDGVATALFMPAAQAFMADVTPSGARGRFLGLVGSVSTLVTILAVTLVGLLYQRVADSLLFGIGAASLALFALLLAYLMRRHPADAMRADLERRLLTPAAAAPAAAPAG